MKKFSILIIFVFVFSISAVLAGASADVSETVVNYSTNSSFKILNDTGKDVQIHTGSGFIELNKGSSTSVTCDVGREIRQATKGKKGEIIFVVDDSMCGKTVKLSKYL